jgi:hypothetical protein
MGEVVGIEVVWGGAPLLDTHEHHTTRELSVTPTRQAATRTPTMRRGVDGAPPAPISGPTYTARTAPRSVAIAQLA